MKYKETHVSINDYSPAMFMAAKTKSLALFMNEEGNLLTRPIDQWVSLELIEKFRDNKLYQVAEGFLDGSPGASEYVRALAEIVAESEGFDKEDVLAALTAFNNSQK